MEFTYFKIQYQDLDNARDFFENDKHYGEFLVGLIDYYRTQNIPEFKTKMVQKYFSTYKKTADYVLGQRKLGVNGGKKRVENQLIKQATLEGLVEGLVEPSLKDPLDTAYKPKLIKDNESKGKEIKGNEIKEIDIIYIVGQLNLIAKKSFSAETAETKKHISARLKKYSKEDCVAVVKYKCKQWLSDLVMSKYIRPNTLFNESKFESYYQEMKSDESSNQEESYTGNWEVQTISQNGKNIQVLSNEEYLKLIELCKNPNRYPMTTIEKAVKTNRKW